MTSPRSTKPPTLAELVQPGTTAVVTQECQGAIVGPDAGLKALADAVIDGTLALLATVTTTDELIETWAVSS